MDKRELIAEAVRELIIERNSSNFSVEDIAKKAGIGKGTVYLYFKNKEQIITFTIFFYLEKLADQVEERVKKGGGSVEKLEILISSYVELVGSASTFWEILFESVPTRELKEEKSRFMKVRSRFLEIIREIIVEGNEEGVFKKKFDPHQLSWIIFMMLRGLGFFVSVVRNDDAVKQMIKDVKEVLLYGVYNDAD